MAMLRSMAGLTSQVLCLDSHCQIWHGCTLLRSTPSDLLLVSAMSEFALFHSCYRYFCCTPFACFFAGPTRTALRNKYGLVESPCNDCVVRKYQTRERRCEINVCQPLNHVDSSLVCIGQCAEFINLPIYTYKFPQVHWCCSPCGLCQVSMTLVNISSSNIAAVYTHERGQAAFLEERG